MWLLIFNRALLGTSISLVMKYADSVIKTFVGSAGLYLAAIMDAVFFGKPLTAATMVGGVIFTLALYLYSILPEPPKTAQYIPLEQQVCVRCCHGPAVCAGVHARLVVHLARASDCVRCVYPSLRQRGTRERNACVGRAGLCRDLTPS